MASFDMRDQKVNTQYIAGRDFNVGAIQTRADTIALLTDLRAQVAAAKAAAEIEATTAVAVDDELAHASQQAQQPEPNKQTIIDHLSRAKDLIEPITKVGRLAATIIQAIDLVQKFF